MVLERQNPEAYSALAVLAASSPDGQVSALRDLETTIRETGQRTNALSPEQLEAVYGKISFNNIREWLAIEPEIGRIDLRPYYFVSRERFVEFLGNESLKRSQLELLEVLESGKSIAIASRRSEFQSLSDREAVEVADALLNRISELSDVSQEPVSMKHLDILASDRPDVQIRFIRFLKSLPVAHLGAWAPARLRAIARHRDVLSEASSLIDAWEAQQENQILATAAKVAKKLG